MPGRGEPAFNHFHANEGRDGQGHVGKPSHDGGNEHALPGGRSSSNRGGGHPR
jgi:hypothetical protein